MVEEIKHDPVAAPAFPMGGGANLMGEGAPTPDIPTFRKNCQSERIAPPLDWPMSGYLKSGNKNHYCNGQCQFKRPLTHGVRF